MPVPEGCATRWDNPAAVARRDGAGAALAVASLRAVETPASS
ncbi:hypothetical protein OG604_22915 [Streptomyces sp. NBC_01231]|nr:hypothetical protein OG604_22915 [Streptomyces sp. NBC_01231]